MWKKTEAKPSQTRKLKNWHSTLLLQRGAILRGFTKAWQTSLKRSLRKKANPNLDWPEFHT
jgi:hypothetical protein